MTKFTAEEANAFLTASFKNRGAQNQVVTMEPGFAVMRLAVDDTHLRPGGYISGPTQMSLADSVAYMAIMTLTGLEPMTVTSNLNINFLRPCIGAAVVAEGRILKMGQALAVIEVDIRVEGADKPSSHAIVTYALPRKA
ncbi:MAG: PaaI family thioesterase [Hyphomonas sp.]|uniref:PaaI family thioesterase n=1 Tax=Hyphomonas sp. TaxID=87 RepID=UPI0017E2490F|nr:PaaI family thioesterase [Hyphomonas sp.]MBA3069482.1 PaaI family thioesterase [Hyphomonas sp.]MBU3920487.1 PaaI family thioesterase [Alphaproteobacteria bacterium]MBU4063864.1 PaaI family thioesterase [Alphaproteobacteria bacterium]MBU4164175.1 PaaI family thioesterase [Alphaproteobacteria bacterium]